MGWVRHGPLVDFDIVARSLPDRVTWKSHSGDRPASPPHLGQLPRHRIVCPLARQTLCPLRGRAISAVRLMTKGGKLCGWLTSGRIERFPGRLAGWSGARPPAGSPCRPHPSTHGIHTQAQDYGNEGRTKTTNPPTPPKPGARPYPELHLERFKPWRRWQQPVRL